MFMLKMFDTLEDCVNKYQKVWLQWRRDCNNLMKLFKFVFSTKRRNTKGKIMLLPSTHNMK